MGIAQLFRPLGLTFSFLGTIQGILWTVFSILGLLVATDVIEIVNILEIGVPIKTINDFSTFLYLYILLSVYWMCLSMYQFWLFQKKKFRSLKNILIQWASLTALISIVDLSLSIIVNQYYSDLNNSIFASMPFESFTGVIIILVIATRGIVLWIFNIGSVVFAVLFIQFLKKEEIRLSRYNDHVKPIDAFDHLNARPTSWFAEVVHDDNPAPRISHVNPAFIDDDIFETDDPYANYDNNNNQHNDYNNQHDGYNTDYNNQHNDYNTDYNNQNNYDENNIERYIDNEFKYIDQSNYSNQYREDDAWNQSFDSVSRSSLVERPRKKEPIKILDMELHPAEDLEPPTIPPPDYTPPNTPVVRARPVLKSNPIYN